MDFYIIMLFKTPQYYTNARSFICDNLAEHSFRKGLPTFRINLCNWVLSNSGIFFGLQKDNGYGGVHYKDKDEMDND